MTTLDCSSIETARTSVAQLLGVTVEELRARARRLPTNEYLTEAQCTRALVAGGGIPAPTWVHWFHASRVVDPQSFVAEGILPRSVMWPRIREHLQSLAVDIGATGSYPNALSAGMKRGRMHEGPYAFLFRGVAVHAPDTTHNYHQAPEGVEDVAGKLVGANYQQLVERYQNVTVPCLVRFRTPTLDYAVEHAFRFVCVAERCDELDAASAANTCYDGDGRAVAPDDIIGVEILTAATRAVP